MLEKSRFQKDSRKYYATVRNIHSRLFCFNNKRITEEQYGHRYQCSQADGIQNIFSFIRILKENLPVSSKIRGLDLGCGSHYFADYLSKNYGWDVVGVDVDRKAINLAKMQYVKNSDRYVCHDVIDHGIPFNDNRLDFIICNSVIQHFSHRESVNVISEAYRTLAAGGILLLIFKKPWREPSLSMQAIHSYHANGDKKTRFEDKVVKEGILRSYDRESLADFYQSIPNIRLYSMTEILSIASNIGFDLDDPLQRLNFEYVSGKGYLCGAVFLRR